MYVRGKGGGNLPCQLCGIGFAYATGGAIINENEDDENEQEGREDAHVAA